MKHLLNLTIYDHLSLKNYPKFTIACLQTNNFQQVLNYLYPGVPIDAISQKMHQCKTSLEFQKAFAYHFLQGLIDKASTGCDMDSSEIDNTKQYTFVSNHRDIVLDSAFLSKLLIDNGFASYLRNCYWR